MHSKTSKSATAEVISDKTGIQADRKMGGPLHIFWTERKNTVSQLVLDAVEEIPLLHELDDSPTRDELVNAIRILPQGKYAGEDCLIPAEVIKSGGNTLSESLYKLLRQCWNEEAVPQEIRDSTIVTFVRNKSDRTESPTLLASISCNGVCRSFFTLLSQERKCLQCRKTTYRS